MPKLTVLPANVSTDTKPGELLLDAGDRAGAAMEAGCMNCSCGTCAIEVVQGMEHLEPPTDKELDILDGWNRDPEKFRLACCTRLLTGEITIRQLH